MQSFAIPRRHVQLMLVSIRAIIRARYIGRSICWRLLKLTHERREVNCSQSVDSGFPTPLRTEALHAGILVCLNDRVEAYLSNAFGEIFYVHILPQNRFD